MAIRPEDKPPFARWLTAQRKARAGAGKDGSMTLDEALAYFETRHGWALARSTYASLESGKLLPNAEHYRLLTDLWGTTPEAEPEPEPAPNTAPEMFDLLAAMAQQTTVVTALIEELRAERQERASMADTVNDLKEQIQALAAGLAEALRAGGGEGGPPTTPTQGGPGARQPDDKKPRSHSPVTDR
jgi:hypothetical protein